jgi:hypothetical protein
MNQKVTKGIYSSAIILLQNMSGPWIIWRHCVMVHMASPPSFMTFYWHYYDNVATALQIHEASNFNLRSSRLTEHRRLFEF